MAIALWLPHIFLALRRLLQLLKSFKGLIPRALRRIRGQLAFVWSILRTKLGFRQRGIGKPPSSSQPQDGEPRTSKARKVTTQSNHVEGEVSGLEPELTSYTLIEQGKKISLDDVALSAYPLSGQLVPQIDYPTRTGPPIISQPPSTMHFARGHISDRSTHTTWKIQTTQTRSTAMVEQLPHIWTNQLGISPVGSKLHPFLIINPQRPRQTLKSYLP